MTAFLFFLTESFSAVFEIFKKNNKTFSCTITILDHTMYGEVKSSANLNGTRIFHILTTELQASTSIVFHINIFQSLNNNFHSQNKVGCYARQPNLVSIVS